MNFPKYDTIFSYASKLLCLFGLIYQTSDLLDAYLQGKTVVNIEIERQINTTLPAITICYPYSISFEKIGQLNEVYQERYEAFLGHSKNFTFLPKKIWHEAIWQKNMKDIYNELVKDVFKRINNLSLDVNQVFVNCSIDNENEQGDKMITIGFNMENMTEHFDYIENVKIDKDINGEWQTEKCFTFFSALDKKWRNSNSQDETIYANLVFPVNDVGLNKHRTIKVALHSPNTFLELNDRNFEILDLNSTFTITYTQLSTKLLDHNYDTNCFNYDLDYKFHNNNMRSDCLTWCYQEKLNEVHHSKKLFPTGSLYRNDVLSKIQNISIAEENYHSIRSSIKKFTEYCHDKCRKDCTFIYYSVDYKGDTFRIYSGEEIDFVGIDLVILHSNLPDIFITYLPKISFLSLVCDFGGLMGMWLGFSPHSNHTIFE